MKLGIISDCVHYRDVNGDVGTENHILLRQLEALSAYFSETQICCPFAEIDNNKVVSYYTSNNIHFTSLPAVGGNRFKDKITLFKTIPKWLAAFRKIDIYSDVVYQRFPNNLNIPGFFYFFFKRKKVFATYTGTWESYVGEPGTYRLQKWLLKKYFQGTVWIYTDKPQLNERILSGFSPSYSETEWDEETEQVKTRIENLKNKGLKVFKMITVGTLIDYKNQLTILKACHILKSSNFPFYLTVVGDGPMYNDLETFIKQNKLDENVRLVGKKDHVALRQLYREHDFVVQAPLAEGFGKVPVEGFFHGVIPIINNIGLANHMTGSGERGFLFESGKPGSLADAIKAISSRIENLPLMITKGRDFAKSQTLEAWAEQYFKTVTAFGKA